MNKTKQYYEENAEKWTAIKTNSFWHEEQFRKFVTYLDEGDTVLDIGSASGIHVPLFLGIGAKLHYEGFDLTESFISIARRRYPHLTFTQGNILDRGTLPDRKYDGFWAVAVLMHAKLEEWDTLLDNIESIMNPGAVGYITLPKKRFTDPQEDMRHFEIFTEEKFRTIINGHGWEIVESGEKESTKRSEWMWFIVKLPG